MPEIERSMNCWENPSRGRKTEKIGYPRIRISSIFMTKGYMSLEVRGPPIYSAYL